MISVSSSECLARFPHKSSQSCATNDDQSEKQQQHLQQQNMRQSMNNNDDDHNLRGSANQVSACNGVPSVNNGGHSIDGLLHQNLRYENQMNNPNGPFSATPGQSSNAPLATQLNPSSPFSCLTPSPSHSPAPPSLTFFTAEAATNHNTTENSPTNIQLQKSSDPNENLSSVERIIQTTVSSSQFNSAGSMTNVGAVGNNTKTCRGMTQIGRSSLGGGGGGGGGNDSTMGNGINSNSSVEAAGFGNFDARTNRIRAAMGNNSMTSTGELGMPLMPQDVTMNNKQPDTNNQFLSGGGGGFNDFNNPQYNWK